LALSVGVAIRAQDREIPRGIQAQPGAPEPPTPAFQAAMQSNSTIVTVDGGGTVTTGTLTKSLTVGKEDFEAVLKDARTLRENFAKIEAFFAQRNIKDAVEFAESSPLCRTALVASTIPGSQSVSFVVRFPGSVGTPGTRAILTVNAGYDQGTLTSGGRIVLP